MNQSITTTLLAVIVTLVTAASGMAQTVQDQNRIQMQPRVGGQTGMIQRVAPAVMPSPRPRPNPYYFGMHVQLLQSYYGGPTLRVTSVDYGSPAWQAGLEIGDEIRSVNGQGFAGARDSFDAVAMINQAVQVSGGFAPASPVAPASPAAPAIAAGAQAYVVGYPRPRPQPLARMVVRNVRNGQDVWVNVTPRPKFIAAPAQAAPAYASPIAPAAPAAGAYSQPMQQRNR